MCRHDPHHESPLDGGHLDVDHLSDEQLQAAGLTRRAALGAAGAGGVALLFAGLRAGPSGGLLPGLGPEIAEAAATTCVMTPAKTEGPFFVDERLNRSDVRADAATGTVRPGLPLTLRMQVFDAAADCAPVAGATVDIWHADASGAYSDVAQDGTRGQSWLRGYQTTDARGLVTFTTIYPGWYPGRAVHIHFKVRVATAAGGTLEFTSQMFFTDGMNTRVCTTASPYAGRSPQAPDTPNGRDGFLGSDAATLTLAPVPDGNGGLAADFSVGVRRGAATAAPSPDMTLRATLTAATMLRTATGARRLRLTVRARETVTVTARLTRGGRTITSRTTTVSAGTRQVRIAIPPTTDRGAARLRVTLADAAGNRRTTARTVHVARRSS